MENPTPPALVEGFLPEGSRVKFQGVTVELVHAARVRASEANWVLIRRLEAHARASAREARRAAERQEGAGGPDR